MADALIEPVADRIRAVAAEVILPLHRNLTDEQIRFKGHNDPVTEADEESERRLTRELRALLPGSLVVGEEAVAADPAVLDRLMEPNPVWIIDPLDGTGNFARGSDVFAVMVALVEAGETRAGWIYAPVSGRMLTAELGGGAHLDGRLIAKDRAARPLGALIGAVHTRYLPAEPRRAVEARLARFARNAELYCAGLTYLGLAAGSYDHALFWRAKPWDHAAGALALAEMGGRTAFLEEDPYAPLARDRVGLLSVRNGERWREIRDALFETA
ncbi:MAG: inositol monophosphatase [Alphaproteobacteria bacterium]|nr:inositol monophosphatase [Alphaproteobacteria bacterium]